MKVLMILNDVRNGVKSVQDAEVEIKLLIGVVVDDAATGIGSVDATEMHGEIEKGIQSL